MTSDLEFRLFNASKEQLVSLLQELAVRHPVILTEIIELSENFVPKINNEMIDEVDVSIDNEAAEDWDFNGDNDTLAEFDSLSRPTLPPLDFESKQQQINSYAERLQNGELHQSIGSALLQLLREAEARADQHDYQGALDLYALVVDKRLAEQNTPLVYIFDKALDESMPFLEALLSETSSSITLDASIPATPLLTPPMRHAWLERLFTLWLKRLDLHQTEEDVPEIMLDVAWNDDVTLLRALVQNELQQQKKAGYSNIVDFSRQHRIRALEKFIKELPYL
ncbi:MAG: hypothetical protein H0V70_14520 [Ktedonobacteraceae bacterium]|nr:hypothetical protein [Ktedonobacteraceae bacterium]